MEEKDLETLEFPKILERLARHAASPPGKELALKLRPTADEAEVRERLEETREARALLGVKADAALAEVRDIRPLLSRAEKGEALLPPEFLEVRRTLIAGAGVKRAVLRFAERAPRLASLARKVTEHEELAEEIGRCINERAEVVDEATPALARLRRELKEAREMLLDRLQELLSSPEVSPFLQESFITERNGRYVIPVKAQYKSRVPGIVHSTSGSGATVFIEPLSLVEPGNRLRELELAEEEEVRRILYRLTDMVALEAPSLRHMLEALACLDLAFAKARYAEELHGVEPQIAPWRGPERRDSVTHPGATIRLRKARHPLLDPGKAVPNDICLDDFFILVISGPNTGGKTVTLKTVGLLALMAQAGMAIPAGEGSALSVFDGIYADIGDEQSIEQSLSTFSSHLTNIIRILDRATSRSLVLLDELGAGTDPTEGAALARGLLSHLLERSITTLAATHISELKAYAHTTPGVANASMEFDPETLTPTYELRIGLPGYSGALAIASRLGLARDIIERAREWLPRQALEAEKLLAEIREARRQARAAQEEAARTLERVRTQEEELRRRLAGIEKERYRIIEETRRQAREEVEGLLQEARRLRSRVPQTPPAEDIERTVQALKELRKQLRTPPPAPPSGEPVKEGDRVWVEGIDMTGEVLEVLGDEALVQVEGWRLRVPLHRLERREAPAAGGETPVRAPRIPSPGSELDLRGRRAEDALRLLDSYLDRAFRAGLEKVRVIHGAGTGTLRRVVREHLSRHPLVASFHPAPRHEGGDGATIVKLHR